MLSLAFLVAFSLHLLLFSYSPLITPIMEEMNLSNTQAGLTFSMSILALIIFRIPWGLISDSIGYLKTLRVSLLIIAVTAILRGFSNNYSSLIIAQVMLGIGLASVIPCLPSIVKEWFYAERVAFSTGVYVSGFALGNMAGLGLTPYLLELTGSWRSTFKIYGIFSLFLALSWWSLGKSRGLKYNNYLESYRNFKEIFKLRELWILLGLVFCSMGTYDTLATWLPRVLRLKGFSREKAGLIASLLSLGFFLAGPVTGIFSDRFRARKPFIFTFGLVIGPVILGIAYFKGLLLLACIFLAGFLSIGVFTMAMAIPTESNTFAESVGSAVGFISALGNLGPFLMPITFGYLIDITKNYVPSIIMVSLVAESIFLFGILLRENSKY
ncbi:MAG: CynX/NimT family MFS transporter [Candidatus Hydrothermarchaeota archaeon]